MMAKQVKKTPQPKQSKSKRKSIQPKTPSSTILKKQKNSSAFSRSCKAEPSPKTKVKSSPLKLCRESKNIKKTKPRKPAVKKSSDKNNEVVALKHQIDEMKRKIKLAEENAKLNALVKKVVASKKSKPTKVPSKLLRPRQQKPKNPPAAKIAMVKSSSMPVTNLKSKSTKKKSEVKPVKSASKKVVSKVPLKKVKKVAEVTPVVKSRTKSGKLKNEEMSKLKTEINVKKSKSPDDDSKSAKKRKCQDAEEGPGQRRRRNDADHEGGHKVAYIHVGEGGERDLESHLSGSSRVNIQILSTERLPDIDESDMIHGLDHAGTSRDYVDESHRCTVRCPVGCQGHLRPNEIVIYESVRYENRLLGRRRMKGRFVEGDPGDEVVAALEVTDFRRIGGSGNRRRGITERHQRRRLQAQQRFRRTMEEDRNESPILPVPARIGIPSGMPQRMSVLLDTPPVPLDIAKEHAWNPNDRSFNVVLKEDDSLTVRRHPVAQSTDCIRSKTGYLSGLHLWEVTWPVRMRGTHAVVGVATRQQELHCVGYQSLVGSTEHSWGWDLGRKKAFHQSEVNEGTNYPPTITHHHQWTVPDIFHMVLDMDVGSLGFVCGNQFLGWAHTGLKTGERVFPVISTVWGHCEVKLKYLGGLEERVVALQELARSSIRNSLSRSATELAEQVDSLALPKLLKKYLKNQV